MLESSVLSILLVLPYRIFDNTLIGRVYSLMRNFVYVLLNNEVKQIKVPTSSQTILILINLYLSTKFIHYDEFSLAEKSFYLRRTE